MIRWLRVVLPPGGVLILVGLIFGLIQGVLLFLAWKMGQAFWTLFDESALALVNVAAIAYAFYRVFFFHPGARPGYFQLLRGTPWTSQKPLPLGPIHIVWQDVVIVAVVVGLLALRLHLASLTVIQVFVAVYVTTTALTLFLTGQRLHGYAIAFGMGVMLHFATNLPIYFAAAAVAYGIALWGLRHALARFPWENVALFEQYQRWLRLTLQSAKDPLRDRPLLGWPYDRLGPDARGILQQQLGGGSWRDILLAGLVFGWFAYVFGVMDFQQHPYYRSGGAFYYTCFLSPLVVARLFFYCNGYVPPINLLGRLLTGRLIIPGYDKIFVAPLLAVLVAVAAGTIRSWTEWYPPLIFAIAVTLTWWVICGVGPSLTSWRLTGNHRIVRGMKLEVTRAG